MDEKQGTRYYCSTCGHTFDSAEELLRHKEESAFRERNMVRCDECGGFFESADAFRDHLQLSHLRRA